MSTSSNIRKYTPGNDNSNGRLPKLFNIDATLHSLKNYLVVGVTTILTLYIRINDSWWPAALSKKSGQVFTKKRQIQERIGHLWSEGEVNET